MLATFSFLDPQKGKNDAISVTDNSITINYPCNESYDCTGVVFELYRGIYNISMVGASGSVKNEFFVPGFKDTIDNSGAGGFVSGLLHLSKKTKFYAHVGGMGTYGDDSGHILQGGYNGGGGTDDEVYTNTGGGGTDLRADVDDPYHRIFVAGGGGGSDDQDGEAVGLNDGAGGAGGDLTSQTFKLDTYYLEGYEANQTFGFSFFTGETGLTKGTKHKYGYHPEKYIEKAEAAGAGGGWFGGFSSHYNNGGASGGSSFALTTDAVIPSGKIDILDKDCNITSSEYYAFSPTNTPFIFTDVEHRRGVWYGNGFITITKLYYTTTVLRTFYAKIFVINMQFILISLK